MALLTIDIVQLIYTLERSVLRGGLAVSACSRMTGDVVQVITKNNRRLFHRSLAYHPPRTFSYAYIAHRIPKLATYTQGSIVLIRFAPIDILAYRMCE